MAHSSRLSARVVSQTGREKIFDGGSVRRIGAGALFRDGLGGVLLVKPSYKQHWEIPGGVVEPEEAPRACCQRELMEELGLEIEVGRLLVVDWLPPDPPRPEGWMFVFDGGVLEAGATEAIRLPPEELLEWRFVQLDEIDALVSDSKARRVRMAHQCAIDGTTADLEYGAILTRYSVKRT